MALHWYLLRIKAHQDKLVFELLAKERVEILYPTYRTRTDGNRSTREQARFPGYIFIRADLDATGTGQFDWMPGTHGLVYRGERPVIVPDQLIEGLRESMAGESEYNAPEEDVQSNQWMADLYSDEREGFP